MASAGQAQAHSSQPMHFSSPSGHRLSWWWPWNRGAVGRLSSGYWTVSTFRNISVKVTPNPLTGPMKSLSQSGKSGTCDLLAGGLIVDADTVVVRQVHRRHRETGRGLDDRPGFRHVGLRATSLRGGRVPRGPLLRPAFPHQEQGEDEHDDEGGDHVRGL